MFRLWTVDELTGTWISLNALRERRYKTSPWIADFAVSTGFYAHRFYDIHSEISGNKSICAYLFLTLPCWIVDRRFCKRRQLAPEEFFGRTLLATGKLGQHTWSRLELQFHNLQAEKELNYWSSEKYPLLLWIMFTFFLMGQTSLIKIDFPQYLYSLITSYREPQTWQLVCTWKTQYPQYTEGTQHFSVVLKYH